MANSIIVSFLNERVSHLYTTNRILQEEKIKLSKLVNSKDKENIKFALRLIKSKL